MLLSNLCKSESQQESGTLKICCEIIILNDIVEMVHEDVVNNALHKICLK